MVQQRPARSHTLLNIEQTAVTLTITRPDSRSIRLVTVIQLSHPSEDGPNCHHTCPSAARQLSHSSDSGQTAAASVLQQPDSRHTRQTATRSPPHPSGRGQTAATLVRPQPDSRHTRSAEARQLPHPSGSGQTAATLAR